jgi:aldehyde oxidoreductase
MDELAEKIGMDPLELRYKNVYRPGATTPTGQTPEVFPFPEMIDIMRPLYKESLAKAAAESTLDVKKGVGVSIGIYGSGLDGVDGAEADVELTPDGVVVYTTWHDHGQGADMGVVGTAHEALRPLGLLPEQVGFRLNDTALTPNGGPAGGSRSQVMIGNAIKDGCEKLIEALRTDGGFRSYDEMVDAGLPLRYKGSWSASTASNCDAETAQGNPFAVYMYGVFMAEVAVDTTTGKTTVEGFTAIGDVGKINNKLVVDGQMYGGIAQGIGLALTEDFEDIKKHSTMRGAGLPMANDIPDKIDLYYVESPREHGPFGAAGVGELPLTSPHAAIVNAIKHATGVRITHLPARPEKVLAGLEALTATTV